MKKFVNTYRLITLGVTSLLISCSGSNHGELVGVQNRADFYPSDPYGMVYIPQGSFNAGNADVDIPATLTAPTKTVSVSSFYMDETEITNNEYRQFVHWVRDSILRYRLAEGLVEEYEYISYADLQNPTYFEILPSGTGRMSDHPSPYDLHGTRNKTELRPVASHILLYM